MVQLPSSSHHMRGYLIHEHPDPSSEGLGSHARSLIYPVIHIALTNYLEPIWTSDVLNYHTSRDYTQLNLSSFLSSQHQTSESDIPKENIITINTWSDAVVGSACGDGQILAELIAEYLRSRKQQQDGSAAPVFIRLVGVLRYMNPTPVVYSWLQERSQGWNSVTVDKDDPSSTVWRVAAHIRVPEDFCPQSWKDENHVSRLVQALDRLVPQLQDLGQDMHLTVYTEDRFSIDDEVYLKKSYKNVVHVVRGSSSTLLDEVRAMATADIFIPASSHLSAMVGYLTHGLILLSDSSRWDYFSHHATLGCSMIEAKSDCEERLKKCLVAVKKVQQLCTKPITRGLSHAASA